jgi:hypothetical protein
LGASEGSVEAGGAVSGLGLGSGPRWKSDDSGQQEGQKQSAAQHRFLPKGE